MEDALCRLCISGSGDLILALDKNRTVSQPNLDSYEEIVKKIDYCFGFKVSQEDTLTKWICSPCLNKLNMLFSYRKIAIAANVFLNKYHPTSPESRRAVMKSEVTSSQRVEISSPEIRVKESISPIKSLPTISASLVFEETPVDSVILDDLPPPTLVELRNEARYECNRCGRMFSSKSARDEHFEIDHIQKDTFRCDICNKMCKNGNGLTNHKRLAHFNKKKNNTTSEMSESSSNESPIFRLRSRSRSASTTTSDLSRESNSRVKCVDAVPRTTISRRGRENSENVNISPERSVCKNKSTEVSIDKKENFAGILKDAKIVLERIDVEAYKKSIVVTAHETKNNEDVVGSPDIWNMTTPIIPPRSQNTILKSNLSNESKTGADSPVDSPTTNLRARKTITSYECNEDEENYEDPDDPDDPPYSPTILPKQDYFVDMDVQEEIEEIDLNGTPVNSSNIQTKQKINKKVEKLTPVETPKVSSAKGTIKKDIVKIDTNQNMPNNNKKRKTASDELTSLFSRKLMVFNLRMADHADQPFRMQIKYTENAQIINKSATRLVAQDTAKEDPGADEFSKSLRSMLSKETETWLAGIYTRFKTDFCAPLADEEETEDEESSEENAENEVNEHVPYLTPSMLNEPLEQLNILLDPQKATSCENTTSNENSADLANVPFIRVKNAEELGIVAPSEPRAPTTINAWPSSFQDIIQSDHSYTSI